MSMMEDGVLYLRKGDDEVVDVSMKDASGETVAFAVGDRVTLTVRSAPNSTTAVMAVTKLITAATAGNTVTLQIPKEVTEAVTAGDYSCDVQVDFADGTRKTIFPPMDTDSMYAKEGKNWKNFRMLAEVTHNE